MNEEDLVVSILRHGRIEFPSHREFRRSLGLLLRNGITTVGRTYRFQSGSAKHKQRVSFDMLSNTEIRITGELGSAVTLCSRFVMDIYETEKIWEEIKEYA